MPNRIIKETITTSANLNSVSPEAEILFYRLIVVCDDHGRFDGRAVIIRARCFPLKLASVSEEDILSRLRELQEQKLIRLYSASDQPVLEMVTWRKHQRVRATRSKYPDPPVSLSHDSESPQAAAVRSESPQPAADGGLIREAGVVTRESRVANRESVDAKRESRVEDEKPAATASNPDAIGVISKAYENIGLITPFVAEKLRDMAGQYPADWICDAMREAVNQEKRSLAYVEAILKRWQQEGRTNEPGRRTRAKGLPGNRPAGAFSDLAE